MQRYTYSVWTNTSGSWKLVLGSNDYAKAQQVVRALQAWGFRSSTQYAGLYGVSSLTPRYAVRLRWGGTLYLYGDAADAGSAWLVVGAVRTLIPTATVFAVDRSTGQVAQLNELVARVYA